MINVSSPSSLFMFPPTPDDILVANSDPLQQPSVDTSPTSDSSSHHLPITFDSSESVSLHSNSLTLQPPYLMFLSGLLELSNYLSNFKILQVSFLILL